MAWRAPVLHAYLGEDDAARAALARALKGRQVRFVDEAELAACLPEVEVLLCGHTPRLDWSRAEKLRLLHYLGAGVDALWPAHGLRPDVIVASSRGIHGREMRDHALAMILAFERDLPGLLSRQRERRWERVPAGSVAGKTVTVLGLGEVGRPIAEACRALGMRVVGVRAEPRPTPGVDEVRGPEDLYSALGESDYVVVALPLTARTRGLLDAAALASLPPRAVLVAISRGAIVDEDALVSALRAGRLRGAALDVFAEEPLPASSPLWSMPEVIVTPHVAGWMPGYIERAAAVVRESLERLERGEQPRTVVDRARQY